VKKTKSFSEKEYQLYQPIKQESTLWESS